MPHLFERAPAKINLSLHILRRRDDGMHALESLVVFSRFGDVLSLDTAGPPGLTVIGPRAADAGPLENNLVAKAEAALRARLGQIASGSFVLRKNLPAAAGIGGGSSDAAAALRLLARANGLALDDPRLLDAARSIGADVPVCLAAGGRMMRGAGDELGPLVALPPICAVLVNPGVRVDTREVFARLALAPGQDYAMAGHPGIGDGMSAGEIFEALRRTRNDLEGPASMFASAISDVLAVLGAARGCRLARMSGSGATCFGLFESRRAAARAAAAIRRTRPQWWVKGAVLN